MNLPQCLIAYIIKKIVFRSVGRRVYSPVFSSFVLMIWGRLLLENDADVEARDSEEWSPFHWACQLGNVYTARLLIAAGEQLFGC